MPCSTCGQTGHNARTCATARRHRQAATQRSDLLNLDRVPSNAICSHCFMNHRSSDCSLSRITRGIMLLASENPSVEIRFDSVYGYNQLSDQQRHMLHRMNRWSPHAISLISHGGLIQYHLDRHPRRPSPEPVFMRDLTPPPVQADKKSMPKHISDQIWELNEPDCQICLGKVEKDDYKLSPCGHHFCSNCFKDVRLDKCGECRTPLTVVV